MRKTVFLGALATLALCLTSCGFFNRYDNSEWEQDPANNYVVHLCGSLEGLFYDVREMFVSIPEVSNYRLNEMVYSFPNRGETFAADVPLSRGGVYFLSSTGEGVTSSYLFVADRDTIRFEFGGFRNACVRTPGANEVRARFYDERDELFREESQALQAEKDALWKNRFTEEFLRLRSIKEDESQDRNVRDSCDLLLTQMMKDMSGYTPEYQAYYGRYLQLQEKELAYNRAYLESNRPSEPLFVILYDSIVDAETYKLDLSSWLMFYNKVYSNKFPNCTLHRSIEAIRQRQSIMEGESFVDFSLPDREGRQQRLSALVKGRPAILQLWATWCGGCCKEREWLQQLYGQYKDQGVVVVEAARELKNDVTWRQALQEEVPGWYDLIALGEDHEVWVKYGYGNAGGAVFLIAPDGTITKIEPNYDEIREFLEKYSYR